MKPPDHIVTYQNEQGGAWHVCLMFGDLCSPTAERSVGAHRWTHLTYSDSPGAALAAAAELFGVDVAGAVQWPWNGKPVAIAEST